MDDMYRSLYRGELLQRFLIDRQVLGKLGWHQGDEAPDLDLANVLPLLLRVDQRKYPAASPLPSTGRLLSRRPQNLKNHLSSRPRLEY